MALSRCSNITTAMSTLSKYAWVHASLSLKQCQRRMLLVRNHAHAALRWAAVVYSGCNAARVRGGRTQE